MTKKSLTTSILLTLALIMGCNNSADDDRDTRGVVNVADHDSEMLSAIKTAKETFSFFEENWKTIKSDGYSLKFALPTTDGGIEHIWFSPTKIQGDKISGECANDPVKIPGLKIGDARTVSRDDISDWMIMIGNKCYGGYTIRVLAKRDPNAAPPFEFMDPPLN